MTQSATPGGGLARRLRRELAGQFAGKVFSAGLTLAATMLLVRFLDRRDYGDLSAGLAFGALFASLNDPGLNQVVLRREPEAGLSLRLLIRQTLGLSLATSGIGMVLAGAVAFAVFAGADHLALVAALLSCVALLPAGLGAAFLPIYQAELRLLPVAVAEVATRVAVVVSLALVVATGAPAAAAAAVMVGCQFVSPVVLAAASRLGSLRPGFDWQIWKSLGHEAAPLAAALGVYSVYVKLDMILVARLGSTGALANYALAYRVIDLASGFLVASMMAVVGPLNVGAVRDVSVLRTRLARLRVATVIAGALLASGGTLLAPWIVRLLAGDRGYAGAVLPLSILFVATAFSALQALYNTTLVALGAGYKLLPLTLGMLAANLVANILLIPPHGATGAAMAMLGTEVASVVVAGLWLHARTPVDPLSPRVWALVSFAAFVTTTIFVVR